MTDFKKTTVMVETLQAKADVTPATPEAARAIRGELAEAKREITGTRVEVAETKAEIVKVDEQAKLQRLALEHLADQVAKATHEAALGRQAVIDLSESVSGIPGLIRRLHELESDRIIGTITADRIKDRKALADVIASNERRGSDRLDVLGVRVDEHDARLTELDLKLGASFSEVDRDHEKVSGETVVLTKRVDEHETFLSKYKQPIAASAGSTGLTLAVIHVAPLMWAGVKAYAVSKGWAKP